MYIAAIHLSVPQHHLHQAPVTTGNNGSGAVTGKRKRSWSRAVFSNLQRKGLERRFQIQKYITKPDRRQLAATLGLTDAQVTISTNYLSTSILNTWYFVGKSMVPK